MMTYNYVWLSLHPLVALVMSETKEEVKAVELSICVGKSLGWMDWWWWSFQALTRDLWSVSGINSVFMFTTMPFLLTFQVCANCSLDYVSVIVILIVKFLLFLFFFFFLNPKPIPLPSELQMFGSGYCSLASYQLKLRHLLFSNVVYLWNSYVWLLMLIRRMVWFFSSQLSWVM